MIKFTISNKAVIHFPKYRLARNFSNVNWYQINLELSESEDIQLAQSSSDVNIICDALIKAISEKIEEHAPIKIIQTSNKIPEFVTQETKELIKKRDNAMITMKTTGNQDNVRQFRTLRNRVHKLIKMDKEQQIKKTFEETEGDTKKQWKTTKQYAGWNKNISPTSISMNGKTINNPKGIADAINLAQISRNIKLHREVPASKIDHKTNYRKLVIGKNLELELRTISMT